MRFPLASKKVHLLPGLIAHTNRLSSYRFFLELGDAIEPHLEIVAGTNVKLLLVVPPRSDPQQERGILMRVKGIGSPDSHVDHIDGTPPA
jgi:hypothetical protein